MAQYRLKNMKKASGIETIKRASSMRATEFIKKKEDKVSEPNEIVDQRPVFIKNYGVSMEIPAFYYTDAKYVPHVKDFVVTMSYHIVPQNNPNSIQTTYIDGRVENNSFNEIYEHTGQNIILNLSKVKSRVGF